ncbi:MAG: phage holin family protein [Planctomycetales bacterium]|nr:phage holin family protein [Planctomycetales bacterium]
MASQTTLNRNSADRIHANGHSATGGVQQNVSALAHDLITLCELQFQLLMWDIKDGKSRVVKAAIMLGIAGVLALGALPVLVMASGYGLRAAWDDLPLWAAMLIPAATLICIAGIMAWIGANKISQATDVFQRTQSEMTENVKWVKAALRRQSAP